MQKYIESVSNRNTGLPVVGASVQVNLLAGGAATIYSDNGVTLKANPLTTDSNGEFDFYAADGRYSLVITGSGIATQSVVDILLEDGADASNAKVANFTATGTVQLGSETLDNSSLVVYPNSVPANRLGVYAGTSGGWPSLVAEGPDSSIGPQFKAKGNGIFLFYNKPTSTDRLHLQVGNGTEAENYVRVAGGPLGATLTQPPVIEALGADSVVHLALVPKGTGGRVVIGAYVYGNNPFMVEKSGSATDRIEVLANGSAGALIVTEGAGGNVDMVLRPKGTGVVSFDKGQLKFPAIQNPSSNVNTLDDYKESSWTPALSAQSPGDLATTASLAWGFITKTGRQVVVEFGLSLSAFSQTTASGAVQIIGMPAGFLPPDNNGRAGALYCTGINKGAGYTSYACEVTGSGFIRLRASGNGIASAQAQIADLALVGGSMSFVGQITYSV